MDFSGFMSGLLSSLAAGAILLWLGYLFIDNRLHLRDRSERRKELETQRQQNLEAVLGSIHGELESAAAQLTTALKEMPSGAILYPLFDVAMWPIVTSPEIFTTLKRETIDHLTHAYNRMTTANDQNQFLSDLNHGSTAILAAGTAALSINDERVREQWEKFVNHREEVRKGVIERLKDLKPHLDNAIDAVEGELRLEIEQPAAQRHYQPATPTGFVGDERTLPPSPETREAESTSEGS